MHPCQTMWRIVKTLRNLGSRFRSYPNQPPSTTCEDCSTSSNFADKSVVPTLKYPFTQDFGADSDRDKSDKENCRSKKTCHNRPSHVDPSAYSLLEALGWGTAALFGVKQYVALVRQKRAEPEETKVKSKCTAGCLLSHYVFSSSKLPVHDRSLVLSVLPKSARSSKSFAHEQPFPSSSFELNAVPSSYSDSTSHAPNESTPLNNDLLEQTEGDNAVTAAARELQAVTNLCVATIQNNVGVHLHKDQPVEALLYFLAGCELGYSKACFNAAVCYEVGLGTAKDLAKAKELYEAAAEKGHTAAMYNLGVYYKEGIGNVPKDMARSITLFERAAAEGLKEAQRALGLHYMQCNAADKAIPFLEAASEQKDPDAEYYLGVAYENGWGVEENMAKAADFYSKAAQKGHLDATYNLAVFYELGLGGIPQQRDTALDMYHKVAATGHAEASIRANYLEEVKAIECSDNDTELLMDSESMRLPSSASAPELHIFGPAEKFSHTHLPKSSSSTDVLGFANLFNTFPDRKSDSNKQNGGGMLQDLWGHQNEMVQTHSLEVPWVGV